MTPEQFAQTYLANEANLRNILKSHRIYDEDLFQDTCLELCEYAQHNDIQNFPGIFIERYKKLRKRQGQRQLDIVPYDNAQLAALDIIDESQTEEKLDRNVDCYYEQGRDRYKERLHQLLDDFLAHPQPGERNHRRACRVLRLYLDGKSEREISHRLHISHQAVHQSIVRIVARLKVATL